MQSLDSPAGPATNAPIWNTVLRYGGYSGALMILFSLVSYLAEANLMSIGGMVMLYGSVLVIGFAMAVLAMRYQRDQLDGGIISYGKALGIGVLVTLIGMFISGVWNYIFINFIDVEYLVRMKEQFVDQWGERMQQEQLDQALEGFDKSANFLQVLQSSLVGGTIFGLIIGLISAAFMKREPMKDYMR